MLDQLPALTKLLKMLQHVPYLSSKNLYRVVDYFLLLDQKQVDHFCQGLRDARSSIIACKICFAWCQVDIPCLFCSSLKRNQSVVCVVETWQELLAIEKTNGYEGVYHILTGVISPLDGIGPDDLTITALLNRIEKNSVQEIILATNQTPEGEATAAYIARKLKDKEIKISCLARGLPVGSILDADRLTVFKALVDRRPF